MKLCILLLLFIMGTLSCEDMSDKVFLFPGPSATAHVILKPEIKKSLKNITICLRSYTELTREYCLFSMATPGVDNAFLILTKSPNVIMYALQEDRTFRIDPEALAWKHTCGTWDSNTGVMQLWVNGKLYPRKVAKKGSIIGDEASIILGQDQDTFGGGFDAGQSFVGEIGDVHMWDYTLTPDEIKGVMSGHVKGNHINWNSLYYDIKGNVLVQPKLYCKSWECASSTVKESIVG
ncbi:C-reactive protein-like [Rana temporaria]|uniref:C-reactive protein-like n=1 Tax=Rana temporaria TaxID=8407 RepID=UPI001AACEEDA|nr:C-reactive protein-like [Rana temporaria]